MVEALKRRRIKPHLLTDGNKRFPARPQVRSSRTSSQYPNHSTLSLLHAKPMRVLAFHLVSYMSYLRALQCACQKRLSNDGREATTNSQVASHPILRL